MFCPSVLPHTSPVVARDREKPALGSSKAVVAGSAYVCLLAGWRRHSVGLAATGQGDSATQHSHSGSVMTYRVTGPEW